MTTKANTKSSPQAILDRVKAEYPELTGLNWSQVMGYDSEVLTGMLGDVLKVDSKSSRPGKRPTLSREAAETEFLKISAEDFSDQEFSRAFTALTYGKSTRNVANKCNISHMQVQRLRLGEMIPTIDMMEKIAKGYNKSPAYFLEYRIAAVLITFNEFLTASPETATHWYLKTRGK